MPGFSRVLSIGLRLYSVSSIRIVLTTESLDSVGGLPPPPPPLPLCSPEQPTVSESAIVAATNHTMIARLFIKPLLCASCRRTSLFIWWMTYRRVFSSGLLGAQSPENIRLSILSSVFSASRVGRYPLGTRALLLFGVCGVGDCSCAAHGRSGKPLQPDHTQKESSFKGAEEPPMPIDAHGENCPLPPSVDEQPYDGRPEGERE